MQDILEEIQNADDAFMSASTPKTLNGVEFEPFSLMRQAIALEITGLNTETAFYEAVIRVWVCTLKPREALLAKRDKEQAAIDAFEWAEKQGFSFENWEPLRDLYKRINDEARAAQVRSDNEESTPKKTGDPALS